jgi:hypothetical protein
MPSVSMTCREGEGEKGGWGVRGAGAASQRETIAAACLRACLPGRLHAAPSHPPQLTS